MGRRCALRGNGRVADAVRRLIDVPETELPAVNVADDRKGERIVLLVAESADG